MNSLLSGAQILALDPNDIDDSNRIGFLHEDKAAALGRLMAVDGQRDPIKVTKAKKGSALPWSLVVGKHRTVGARLEGIQVFAIEVSGKPEDLADLEASENLHRRPLGPLERAKFTAALVTAAQDRIARQHGALKQHQLAVKARWDRVKSGEVRPDQALQDECDDTGAKMDRVYGWRESVADALGFGISNIKRAMRLYRLVIEPFPDLVEALSRHPVVGGNDKQLRDIADIGDQAQRRKVIEALLADNELSVDAAVVQIGLQKAGTAPSHFQKFSDQITGAWSRLNMEQQRRFIETNITTLCNTPDLIRRAQAQLAEKLAEIERGADDAR